MRNWFRMYFLFFVMGLLVYSNSLNNKFLIDDYAFLHNPVFSSTKFILSQWNPYGQQLRGVVDSHEMLAYYRPMAHTVLDFCYAAFKHNFWQYHLLNLLLFVLAASLIYLFIIKITGNESIAFLAGLFYLIHPINGIVVNYISASVIVFQVIFMLGTILLLWESLERKNNWALYFSSLLFSFLSLFWHESGIMTPFYVSAVVLLFRKDSWEKKGMYLFPYFLIILSYVFFRMFFLTIPEFTLRKIALFHMTVWEYLAVFFQVMMWYITRLFYPQGIVMAWMTPVVHQHVFWNCLGLILLVMIFFVLFIRAAKAKICRLALVWLFIGFAPVCLAAFRRPDSGAYIEPHWFIFSSIGFFILAAYFFIIIFDRTKKGGLVLLFIVILAWSTAARAHNQVWADQKRYALFWSQQVPQLKTTYFYLADAYQREGAFNESKKYYRLALAGHPSDIEIYNNLGILDEREGLLKEAELNYRRALKISPSSASTYCNLGTVYLKEGQRDKARKYFEQSLVLNPLLIEPRRNLARIFLGQSEYQKAIDLCLENLKLVNDDTRTLLLLIDIYAQKKDMVSIKEYAGREIKSQTDPEVLTQFGVVMAREHLPELAMDCYIKAMRVDPGYGEVYLEAGTLLANMGQKTLAIHMWEVGLSINPADNRFKENILKFSNLRAK